MEKWLSASTPVFGFELEKPYTSSKLTLSQRKALRRAESLVGKNKGRWSQEEQKNYYNFIIMNQQFFINSNQRRKDKIFKIMSKHIKSRSADQCRIHHQKLLSKLKQFSKILNNLTSKFEGDGKCDGEKINKFSQNSNYNQQKSTLQNISNGQSQQMLSEEICFLNYSTNNNAFNDIQIEEIDIFSQINLSKSVLNLDD